MWVAVMIVCLGINWGFFVYYLIKAIRMESKKSKVEKESETA